MLGVDVRVYTQISMLNYHCTSISIFPSTIFETPSNTWNLNVLRTPSCWIPFNFDVRGVFQFKKIAYPFTLLWCNYDSKLLLFLNWDSDVSVLTWSLLHHFQLCFKFGTTCSPLKLGLHRHVWITITSYIYWRWTTQKAKSSVGISGRCAWTKDPA